MKRFITAFFVLFCLAEGAVGAQCRLSSDRCKIVFAERTAHKLDDALDCSATNCNSHYSKFQAFTQRSADRLDDQLRHLDADVSRELGRILVCDSLDRLHAARGSKNADPMCK